MARRDAGAPDRKGGGCASEAPEPLAVSRRQRTRGAPALGDGPLRIRLSAGRRARRRRHAILRRAASGRRRRPVGIALAHDRPRRGIALASRSRRRLIVSAARRAAVHSALTAEARLARHARSPEALDAFCMLFSAVERVAVTDAALAACAADDDEILSATCRALLTARVALRAVFDAARTVSAAAHAPVDTHHAPSMVSALERFADAGVETIEVPRPLIRAGFDGERRSVRILRAAFFDDDDFVIAAMAGDIDPALLRAARRIAGGKPLRVSLRLALAAFGSGEERERALAWHMKLDAVRRMARKKHSMLAAAVTASGEVDPEFLADAVDADAFWDSTGAAPDAATRVMLLCDAAVSTRVAGVTLVPHGCAATIDPVVVEFGEAAPQPVDARMLSRALGIDVEGLLGQRVRVGRRWSESIDTGIESGEPLPPAEAEVPFPVRAGDMTFSASRLSTYAKCPRRWFYEYLCDAVDERTSYQATYGKVFHAALEALHSDVREPLAITPDDAQRRLHREIDTAFDRSRGQFASRLECEVSRAKAHRVAGHYLKWLYAEAETAPFEIIELESRSSVSIGGHRFVGYIDRVDRPVGGGPVTIFDYKTGRIETDAATFLAR